MRRMVAAKRCRHVADHRRWTLMAGKNGAELPSHPKSRIKQGTYNQTACSVSAQNPR